MNSYLPMYVIDYPCIRIFFQSLEFILGRSLFNGKGAFDNRVLLWYSLGKKGVLPWLLQGR